MPVTATSTPSRDRLAVFGGVAVALVGTFVFARGIVTLETDGFDLQNGGRLLALAAGVLLLATGIGLATTTRFGAAGLLAAFGVPALAMGLTLVAFAFTGPSALQTASADAASREGGSGILLTLGIVASMVGMSLLFTFGVRARR